MEKYIIIVEYPNEMVEISREVFDYLKTTGSCLQLTFHSFMLSTDSSAIELRDVIKGISNQVERVFVSKMALPAAWSNSLSESSAIKEFFHE